MVVIRSSLKDYVARCSENTMLHQSLRLLGIKNHTRLFYSHCNKYQIDSERWMLSCQRFFCTLHIAQSNAQCPLYELPSPIRPEPSSNLKQCLAPLPTPKHWRSIYIYVAIKSDIREISLVIFVFKHSHVQTSYSKNIPNMVMCSVITPAVFTHQMPLCPSLKDNYLQLY